MYTHARVRRHVHILEALHTCTLNYRPGEMVDNTTDWAWVDDNVHMHLPKGRRYVHDHGGQKLGCKCRQSSLYCTQDVDFNMPSCKR